MKTRIKVENSRSGIRYYPQYRTIFGWKHFGSYFWDSFVEVEFKAVEDAQHFIDDTLTRQPQPTVTYITYPPEEMR